MLFDSKRLREILDSRKRLNALQTPTHQDDDVKVEVSNTLEDTKDLTANKQGENVRLDTNGENNMTNVILGDRNIVLQIFPETLNLVNRSEQNFEKIASLINPEIGIKQVAVGSKSNPKIGFKINEEEKQLFKEKTKLEKQPVVFRGRIFRIDGYNFTGKLKVISSSDDNIVKQGDYNFEMINKLDIDKLSQSFMKDKTITALIETTFDSVTLNRSVRRFMIIDIDD